MKPAVAFFFPLLLSLSATGAAGAAPAAGGVSQEEAGRRAIHAILSGNLDSIKAHFEPEVRPHLTQKNADEIRGQFGWFHDLIGGDLVQFLTGSNTDQEGNPFFFREYRFNTETDTRAPLIVLHLLFADSTTPYVGGMQVKSSLGVSEKRLAGAQRWAVRGRTIEIHSVALADAGGKHLLAVMFHDPDTAALDKDRVAELGLPIVRQAIARGLLDTARAALPEGKTLSEEIGVGFIRQDSRHGYQQIRVSFRPEEYAPAKTAGKAGPGKKPAGK